MGPETQAAARVVQLVRENWEKGVRGLSELFRQLMQHIERVNPERRAVLWESMLQEYASDLKEFAGSDLTPDLGPLAEAWRKVADGSADEAARKVISRFLDGMEVKGRCGAEYYADPQKALVGQSPRDCVWEEQGVRLYRYRPPGRRRRRRARPVLLVYSIINRPFLLDLVPGHSFIEHLLARGLDVYLVDWGKPKAFDRDFTLDRMVDPLLANCVRYIRESGGCERVALFGHCIGGNLAILYSALFPQEVDRLITLTTPMTAPPGGVMALWTDREVFPVEAIVDTYGLVPAKFIRYTFMALKPYSEMLKWKRFIENLGNDAVMQNLNAVDRWANENVDVPGEVFKKFVAEVYHADRFCRSMTLIHDRRVDLKAITCPLMNLAASRDWIVPLESARILCDLVGSQDKRFVVIEGAHVSIMADPGAARYWTQMSDFLLESA